MKTELKWWIPLSILAFSLYAYTNTTRIATSTPSQQKFQHPILLFWEARCLP